MKFKFYQLIKTKMKTFQLLFLNVINVAQCKLFEILTV